MVKVLFADLSRTIDITQGEVSENMCLKDVLGAFNGEWNVEDITVSGRPITRADLEKSAREMTPGWQKESILQIEKHR